MRLARASVEAAVITLSHNHPEGEDGHGLREMAEGVSVNCHALCGFPRNCPFHPPGFPPAYALAGSLWSR
jgi:hypothetical protein